MKLLTCNMIELKCYFVYGILSRDREHMNDPVIIYARTPLKGRTGTQTACN
jgi:hypothetical protein